MFHPSYIYIYRYRYIYSQPPLLFRVFGLVYERGLLFRTSIYTLGTFDLISCSVVPPFLPPAPFFYYSCWCSFFRGGSRIYCPLTNPSFFSEHFWLLEESCMDILLLPWTMDDGLIHSIHYMDCVLGSSSFNSIRKSENSIVKKKKIQKKKKKEKKKKN